MCSNFYCCCCGLCIEKASLTSVIVFGMQAVACTFRNGVLVTQEHYMISNNRFYLICVYLNRHLSKDWPCACVRVCVFLAEY